ncbi:MAG: homoserine dehydrogenase [Synergistes sp.]|nr:homoserine dehydrogenase [Synergistes sp.]
MEARIALVGCGNVGTALLELLKRKEEYLKSRCGFEYKVVLVSDLMKGTLMDPEGIDIEKVLTENSKRRSFSALGEVAGTLGELMEAARVNVLAECTPTNLNDGEPGLSHIRDALSRGISVTTTNKGPLAVAFDDLVALAKRNGAEFLYEGVVMSGTPLIDMIKNGIVGCSVLGFEGILNGTTNFMLGKMANGESYAEALADAQSLGYAETDPTGDVDGWDAAVKVAILGKIIYGKTINVNDIARTGIRELMPKQMDRAKEHGCVVKLVAGINFDSAKMNAYVMPREVPCEDPLANVGGAANAITVKTDNLGDITLTGPGAGRRETAQALLSDIIRIMG